MASDSPEASDMQSKLLAELSKHSQPRTALELAKALGFQTRKSVNPTLYDMKKRGLVEIDQSSGPPKWYLPSSSGAATVVPREHSRSVKQLWRAGDASVSSQPCLQTHAPPQQHHGYNASVAASIQHSQKAEKYTLPGLPTLDSVPPTMNTHHDCNADLPSLQTGIGSEVLYRREEREGETAYVRVTAVSGPEPTLVPISESRQAPPNPPPHPVQESTGTQLSPQQRGQSSRVAAQASGRVSRPMQVEVDDRQQPPMEPVAPPHPLNFAGSWTKSLDKGAAKNTGGKNMSALINKANNPSTEEERPLTAVSDTTLASQGSGLLESTSSLSSLTLEQASTDSDTLSSGTWSTIAANNNASLTVGSEGASANDNQSPQAEPSRSSKKKKPEIAAKFPGSK